MTSAKQLLQAFDELLQPQQFEDYGPNGLQVEGKVEVRRIVSAAALASRGHHASGRNGAPAVAAHVAARLGLEHHFIDIDNPA